MDSTSLSLTGRWEVSQPTAEVKEGGLRLEFVPPSPPLSKPMCFRVNGAEKKAKGGFEQAGPSLIGSQLRVWWGVARNTTSVPQLSSNGFPVQGDSRDQMSL